MCELQLAMKEGDLLQIGLLVRQIDELTNGICKVDVREDGVGRLRKGVEEGGAVRMSDSVVDFVRRLRSGDEGEEEEDW